MSSSIVHFGKGNYGAIPEGDGRYIDPTVAKPRLNVIPASRLQALRRIKAAYAPPPPEGPTRYRPAPLLELKTDQCRYPVDDHRFCGAKTAKDISWCQHHDDIVHGRAILEAAE